MVMVMMMMMMMMMIIIIIARPPARAEPTTYRRHHLEKKKFSFSLRNQWYLKDSDETDSTAVFLPLRRFGWSNHQLKRTV